MKISKELVSAVLGEKVDNNWFGVVCKNKIEYTEFKRINVYELAHKCKEWAWTKHLITIRSGYAEFGGWSNFAHNNISFCSMDIPFTEPEAVFIAGQWILDNQQNKRSER